MKTTTLAPIYTGIYLTEKSAAKAGGTYGPKPEAPDGMRTILTKKAEYKHIPQEDYMPNGITSPLTYRYAPEAPEAVKAARVAPVAYAEPTPKRRNAHARTYAPANGRPVQLALF